LAVDPSTGCRVGPPGSTEELEYGMLREIGAVVKKTPVVTIADSYALVKGMSLGEGALCAQVPADIICTAERTLTVRKPLRTMKGIDWEKLGQRRLGSMRLLRLLKAAKAAAKLS